MQNLTHAQGGSHPPGVRNLSCWRPRRLVHPSQNAQRSPDLQNPPRRSLLLLPLLLSHPSWKTKKLCRETEANLNHASEWVYSYIQMNEWVPNWWREFRSLLFSKEGHSGDVQVKGLDLLASHGLQVASYTAGKGKSVYPPQ